MINQLIHIDEQFRDLMPPLSPEAHKQLEESILAEGCREPLVVWMPTEFAAILLDGHNRHAICEANKIEYQVIVKTASEIPDRDAAIEWILRNQLGRRNLTAEQFKHILGRLYNHQKQQHGGDRKSSAQNEHLIREGTDSGGKPQTTAERLAREHGVSPATVRRAGEYVEAIEKLKEDDPEIEQKVIRGDVTTAEVIEKTMPVIRKRLPAVRQCNGVQYAKMAIVQLRKINRKDTQRDEAFDYVVSWIGDHRIKAKHSEVCP